MSIAMLGAGILVAAVSPAHASTPAATYDYSMDGAFDDTTGTSTMTAASICTNSSAANDLCNIAANFGHDKNGDFWHWRTDQNNGGGAVLTTPTQFGATYSIYIKFAIDNEAEDADASNCDNPENNYSSVFNVANLTTDYGFYTAGCDPDLYLSTGLETSDTSVNVGDVVEAVITRDDVAKELKVFINYADGFSESWVVDDSSNDFLIADNGGGSILRLFQDDGIDNSHEGVKEGRLYGLKIWANTELTLEQITPLATVTPNSNNGGGSGNGGGDDLAPTGGNSAVGAWALGLAIAAGAGALVLRRRKS